MMTIQKLQDYEGKILRIPKGLNKKAKCLRSVFSREFGITRVRDEITEGLKFAISE